MNRTAEKALSIISASFILISIIFSFIGMGIFNLVKSDPFYQEDLQRSILADPAYSAEDADTIFWIIDFLSGFMWFIIIILFISLILSIVGIVNIWNSKNPKLAGTLFIIAGVFSGLLSLTSILLYIAGVLSFTKKTPLKDDIHFMDTPSDGTMRPL